MQFRKDGCEINGAPTKEGKYSLFDILEVDIVKDAAVIANDPCYIIDARFHQVRRINGEFDGLCVYRVKKHLEILAIHHRLVVVMMQGETDPLIHCFFSQMREQRRVMLEVCMSDLSPGLAVTENDALSTDRTCEAEEAAQRGHARLIQQATSDQARSYARWVRAPSLKKAFRLSKIWSILTVFELQAAVAKRAIAREEHFLFFCGLC